MSDEKKQKTEKACGCIIVEENKVLLVKQTEGFWGFPKGHVEENETEEETAAREVKEETNVDVEIQSGKKYVEKYTLPNGNPKEVVFFLAKKIGGEEIKQDDEISELKWCTFSEAMETLTYDNTKKLLKKAIKDIEK